MASSKSLVLISGVAASAFVTTVLNVVTTAESVPAIGVDALTLVD